MKKITKVICAIVALVMLLNTPPQIYAAEPPNDAEKTNLSATEKIEPIEPTPTDPDAKIYGIKLSQNREFLLPGGTLQLTVRGTTDPDEIPEIPQSPYLTEDSYSDESNMYLENENELNETYATTIESEDETYELKQGHPRVCSEQEVHPHRNHNEHNHCALRSELHSRKNIRQRISDQKTNNGCDNAEPQRTQKCACVVRQTRNVIECECARLVRKCIVKNHYKRDNNENCRPNNVRCGTEPLC